MQQKRLILLVILGALLALLGIITFQYIMVLVILVIIVIALLFKQWVESLVEKILAGNRSNPSEIFRMNETVASMRADIAHIKERLDALERREIE